MQQSVLNLAKQWVLTGLYLVTRQSNTGIFGKEARLFGTSRYLLGIMAENILAEVIAD